MYTREFCEREFNDAVKHLIIFSIFTIIQLVLGLLEYVSLDVFAVFSMIGVLISFSEMEKAARDLTNCIDNQQ